MSDFKLNTPLYSPNATFIEELYNKYVEDKNSVDPSWQEYFKSLGDNTENIKQAFTAAPWKPRTQVLISSDEKPNISNADQITLSAESIRLTTAAYKMIDAYRIYGHTQCHYDPLGLAIPQPLPDLDYHTYGLDDSDLRKTISLGPDFSNAKTDIASLISFLKNTYCSRIGIEFMHVESIEERIWIQSKIESTQSDCNLHANEKKKALFDITEAAIFENFLHVKFPGTKRFSIEGGESAITSIEYAIIESVKRGGGEFIIGMAHRGRLNVLTKVIGKPYHAMISEFRGELAFPDYMDIPGDVKYHLGASNDIEIEGKKIHLSLTPNPSHLEVVNSVVLGKVRSKQDQINDIKREKVVGILIHGDAAFAGQGSVAESLYLSQLKGYHTGGTLHFVINNQMGFTTNPRDARSTRYCTDIMKAIGAPIIHVNGNDIEAVVFASKIAAEYRAIFKKDIALDIVCYRKYGHNEGDEPLFTQPLMYKQISKVKSPDMLYAERLISQGLISRDEYEEFCRNFKKKLDEEFALSATYKPTQPDWLKGKWHNLTQADKRDHEPTGVDIDKLKEIGFKLCSYPQGFKVNSKLERQLQAKRKMFETGAGIDWATAEAMAFGSLLIQGYGIRMTGQDVKRGTFSHRHAVFFDQETEEEFIPLNHITEDQRYLEIHNSNLSEFAVLGFEYGYSFTDPQVLTLWEAQFGDFANGAQVIIDQYIASGEAKWLRMNGLVMLLPHGYEGQGPEHSSARLERFLQLCAKDNMQVLNCTTPASYFHALRRQVCRNFRKPLIVMSPKSLLRHKLAVSNIQEMGAGTIFKLVLPEIDDIVPPSKVNKVIICSGKVYYDLYERRQELKINDTAIIRLEQLYPFPRLELAAELSKYSHAEIIWCQEEHENMGAFRFIEPKFEKVLADIKHSCKRVRYIGRQGSASPAVGYMRLHQIEHKKSLDEVFQ